MNVDYAVVEVSGKQEITKVGDTLLVEKVDGKVGDKINLKTIFAVDKNKDIVFDPKKLDDVKVEVEIVEFKKGPKLHIMRYKNKTRQHRKIGYRASLSLLKVTQVGNEKLKSSKSENAKKTLTKPVTKAKTKASPAKPSAKTVVKTKPAVKTKSSSAKPSAKVKSKPIVKKTVSRK